MDCQKPPCCHDRETKTGPSLAYWQGSGSVYSSTMCPPLNGGNQGPLVTAVEFNRGSSSVCHFVTWLCRFSLQDNLVAFKFLDLDLGLIYAGIEQGLSYGFEHGRGAGRIVDRLAEIIDVLDEHFLADVACLPCPGLG